LKKAIDPDPCGESSERKKKKGYQWSEPNSLTEVACWFKWNDRTYMQYLCILSIVVLNPMILNNIYVSRERMKNHKHIERNIFTNTWIKARKFQNVNLFFLFFSFLRLTLLRYLIACSKCLTFFMRKEKKLLKKCWF